MRQQDLLAPVRTLTHVRFRANKRMAQRENIMTDAARWLDDYRELEVLLGEESPWALEDVAAKLHRKRPGVARAQSAAAVTRQALGLTHDGREELIRDVAGLFEDHGIKVLTADVKSEGFFGMSVGAEDGGPAVFVNVWDRISVERWIFTAVHELGHLLLHPGAYNAELDDEVDEEEREADAFAGYFLMPPSLFEKEWEEARGLGLVRRVFKLKRIFRVSWQTVLYRVAASVDAGERRKVWATFEKLYEAEFGRPIAKTEEPLALDPGVFLTRAPTGRAADEPARLTEEDFCEDRLRRLVRQGVEGGEISMSRAAEILGCSLREMRGLAASWLG